MSQGERRLAVASALSGIVSLIIGLPGLVESSATWIVWLSRLANLAGGPGFFLFVGAVALIVSISLWAWPRITGRSSREASISPLEASDDESSTAGGPLGFSSRIYTKWTPRELMDLGKDRTSLDARRLKEPHLGKWLQVEGKVSDIDQFKSGNFYVRLSLDEWRNIILIFDKNWGHHIETMQAGDYLKADGKIDSFDQFSVKLEECEIVNYRRP